MAEKFRILVCLVTVLQMYDAAITGSNVVYTSNSVQQATGGIAVDHPAQATLYAKRGKLNVLIPFEFTIIPLSQNSIEPEVPSRSNTPVSGSISSQPNSNYYRSNPNVYRPVYYQTSSYPWYNNNYNNRGFYVPATPSVSSSYQPFIQPNQQYQNGYRPIIYQQQLPANTYRSQYYPSNSNIVYAQSYQQQPLRRIEMRRPWPQYNPPNKSNQQQQTAQPGQPNWSANNTKPININEMNSMHPPNTTTTPPPINNNNNNNQSTSVTANSTTSVQPHSTVGTVSTMTPAITETIPTTKDQQQMRPTDSANGPSNPNNSIDDTQKEKAKPIDAEPVPANQHGEATSDKKDSLPKVKRNLPENSGETGSGGKVEKPESSHTDTAPTPIDNNNNNIDKSENTNHGQASVVSIN